MGSWHRRNSTTEIIIQFFPSSTRLSSHTGSVRLIAAQNLCLSIIKSTTQAYIGLSAAMDFVESGGGNLAKSYREYKELTNGFLDWLWCQYRIAAPQGDTRRTFKYTKDILHAAKILEKGNHTVPAFIVKLLRGAIAKRKYVFSLYQALNAGDAKHAAFVERPQETLAIVAPLASRSTSTGGATSATPGVVTPNPYSHLRARDKNVRYQAKVDQDGDEQETIPTLPSKEIEVEALPSREAHIRLEDDYLTEVLDAAYFLIDLELAHNKLKHYWQDATTGKAPLATASWLTSCTLSTAIDKMPPSLVQVCFGMFANKEKACKFFRQFLEVADPVALVSLGTRLYQLAHAMYKYERKPTNTYIRHGR
ncbi:hypothetical protein CSAL01_04611 [Colletotrichum salicis]|uniref:DUF6604 domain-containing protein n=1 Tax=Colletotrichum salicis TaxID=1209931 RepID=A0A135S6S0_9PEZI|nr:hypothetical protein CSAL01_04611 [Colletotrichum salicis]